MRHQRLNRRRFVWRALLASLPLVAADAGWLEPGWVKIKTVRIAEEKPRHRLAHITDLHHKGDRPYLESVVRKLNALSPDLVCFTGDLVEDAPYLKETLDILSGIKAPLYGVPGNHDYWAKLPFEDIRQTFAATGGAWLMDGQASLAGGKLLIHGAACRSLSVPFPYPVPEAINVLLMHYPAFVDALVGRRFNLILAGHSHGGQVRIPFWGAIHVPFDVGPYEKGLFQTAAGPLYVNPGIGWFLWRIRFNCRPEITVFEV
jgi:predicted MPP superfamily phosphohydrolase